MPAPSILQHKLVQTFDRSGSLDKTSIAGSLDTPATAGNHLILVVVVDKATGTWGSAPSGWTLIGAASDDGVSMAAYRRVAAGGETGATATWSTATYGGHALMLEVADATGYAGASTDLAGTVKTTVALGPVTPGSAPALALAFVGTDTANVGQGYTWNNSFVELFDIAVAVTESGQVNSGTPGFAGASKALESTASVSVTATCSHSDDQMGILVVFNGEEEPDGPAIVSRWSGGVTHEAATIVARTNLDSESVRANVYLASDTATIVAQSPTAEADGTNNRMARMPVEGLAPATAYVAFVEIDEEEDRDAPVAFTTAPTPGTPSSFAIGFASCATDGSESDAFTRILARNPAFFLHMGDLHYADHAADDEGLFWASYNTVLGSSTQQALYAGTPIVYMWDDHDFGNNDSAADSPTRSAARKAYRRCVPSHPLPEPAAVSGGCVSFNGVNQGLIRTSETGLVTALGTAYSGGAWVYLETLGMIHGVLNYRQFDSAAPFRFQLVILEDGTVRCGLRTNGAVSLSAESTTPITAGAWHHVAFVRDGNSITPYVNGVAGTTASTESSLATIDSNTLTVGIQPNGLSGYYRQLKGRVDEAFLYSKALTPEEVAILAAGATYDSLSGSLLTGRAAWWGLGERSGNRQDSHGSYHLGPTNAPPAGEDDRPIYHAFTRGRVRFVVTDSRSERSPKAATDDAAKTVLGATQEAWFLGQLAAAKAAGQVVVWVNTYPWIASASAGADHWGGYTTSRARLANAIKALDMQGRICMLSGDAHMLAADSGANADYATGGGADIPVCQAAPLGRETSTKGGPYSAGTYAPAGEQRQYGMLHITDTGGASIGFEYRGHATNDTVQMSLDFTLTPLATGPSIAALARRQAPVLSSGVC